jgi:hypothetical protein
VVLCLAKNLPVAVVVPAVHWLESVVLWMAILVMSGIAVWVVTDFIAGRVIKKRVRRKADPSER